MKIRTIDWNAATPQQGVEEIVLRIDRWNDFSFVTMFQVYVFDENGQSVELGSVKIGYSGQTTATSTHSQIAQGMEELPKGFFSLGVDVTYYEALSDKVSNEFRQRFCQSMRDVVYDEEALDVAAGEEVFRTSLLRSNSMSAIRGQYRKVLDGGRPLSNFNFSYIIPAAEDFAAVTLDIEVEAGSLPRTNVHALIGRNGVGKTTLLNDMTTAAVDQDKSRGAYWQKNYFANVPIDDSYFSSVISVSFSAFDPFDPPADIPNPETGPAYHYIGLKDNVDLFGPRLKQLDALNEEVITSLNLVFSEDASKRRWINAIQTLESDENFAEMNMVRLASAGDQMNEVAKQMLKKMSSGHAVVMLIISRLVEKVQEKTLVLIDEPESHLHPPLLSALTRSISDLLYNRNGVALIATHSPVVLQEIPRSCVWKITRSKLSVSMTRPQMETFGENVGTLTREVFGLEVSKSGFHSVLAAEVAKGKSFAQIMDTYQSQIGFEAQAILLAMIAERENKAA